MVVVVFAQMDCSEGFGWFGGCSRSVRNDVEGVVKVDWHDKFGEEQ